MVATGFHVNQWWTRRALPAVGWKPLALIGSSHGHVAGKAVDRCPPAALLRGSDGRSSVCIPAVAAFRRIVPVKRRYRDPSEHYPSKLESGEPVLVVRPAHQVTLARGLAMTERARRSGRFPMDSQREEPGESKRDSRAASEGSSRFRGCFGYAKQLQQVSPLELYEKLSSCRLSFGRAAAIHSRSRGDQPEAQEGKGAWLWDNCHVEGRRADW